MIDRITFQEEFITAQIKTPSGLKMEIKLTPPTPIQLLECVYWENVIEHLEKAAIERDRL